MFTEIIVSDGGSTDDTLKIAREAGARIVDSTKGRGHQLRAGASVATAPLLGFLHADTRLDKDAQIVLARLVHDFAMREAYASGFESTRLDGHSGVWSSQQTCAPGYYNFPMAIRD